MVQLKRALGLPSLVFYGVGLTLGAGIYSVIGLAAGQVGAAVWQSFVAAGVVAALTALSYAELATALPQAGAEFVYVTEAFPRRRGIARGVALAMAGSGIATGATVALAFAGYLSTFVELPTVPVALALLAAATAVNIIGIRQSTWSNIVFTIIEAAGLVLVIAVALRVPSFGDALLARPQPAVLTTSALVFFSYLGFENVANLAEEAKHPARNLPRAILLSLAICTVLYILVALAAVALLSPDRLAASSSPLATAVAAHVPVLRRVLGAIALFATANTGLITLVVSSRLLFGVARAGDLPRPLAAVLPGRRTPWVAALVCFGAAAALVPLGRVDVVASVSSLASLVAFTAVNIAVIALRYRKPGLARPFRVPLAIGRLPVLSVLATLSSLLLLAYAAHRVWSRITAGA